MRLAWVTLVFVGIQRIWIPTEVRNYAKLVYAPESIISATNNPAAFPKQSPRDYGTQFLCPTGMSYGDNHTTVTPFVTILAN